MRNVLTYKDIKEDIISKINSCELQADAVLPTRKFFKEKYNVATATVDRAILELQKEGYAYGIQGKGTFIKRQVKEGEAGKILLMPDPVQQGSISWGGNYIIPGIEIEAKKLNMKIEVCSLQIIEGMDFDSGVKFIKNAEVKGAIIFGGRYNGNESYIKILRAANCPVVMAACYPNDTTTTGFPGIRTDRRTAWEDGINFLKSKGHRDIATITNRYMHGYGENHGEYRDFLEQESLYRSELIKSADYNYDAIKDAFYELMKLKKAPTAVMCYSDFYAIHLFRAAKELGIKLPAVMGFSGFPGAAHLEPSLSTVDFSYAELGKRAVELLNKTGEWFNNPNAVLPDIVHPHEIIERNSTANIPEKGIR